MKTLLIAAIVGAVLALLTVALSGSGTVSADGGPHVENVGATTDSCAGCHRAHTAQASNILKEAQPGLCYTCHGTGGAGSDLDVQNGIALTGTTALRGGGFDFARINTSDASLPPTAAIGILGAAAAATSAHTVDGTSETLWGNGGAGSGIGGSYGLRCGSCHDPHGNGLYRILRPSPPGSGGGGQSVTDEVTKDYDTTDYFNVSYLDGTISTWCSQCHTRYLASSGSEGSPLSGDAIFTYRHRSDGQGTAPTCIKCHAAHGSNAVTVNNGYSEGVPWPGGTPAAGENSRLLKMDNRGICQKCHNK